MYLRLGPPDLRGGLGQARYDAQNDGGAGALGRADGHDPVPDLQRVRVANGSVDEARRGLGWRGGAVLLMRLLLLLLLTVLAPHQLRLRVLPLLLLLLLLLLPPLLLPVRPPPAPLLRLHFAGGRRGRGRGRGRRGRRGVNLEHRHVQHLVHALHLGGENPPIRQRHLEVQRVAHKERVGDEVALRREDDARARGELDLALVHLDAVHARDGGPHGAED